MKMMINGNYVDASDGGTIAIHNSATQEFIETVPAATEVDVQSAITAAQEGKKIWGDMPNYKRNEILLKCAHAIEKHKEELAQMLSKEMGKLIGESRGEIGRCERIFRGYPEMANHLFGQVLPDFTQGSEESILFTTIRKFKGLESDVVIYINHTYKNEPKTDSVRATLYTAHTRARFYLYVLDFEESRRI